MDCSTADNPLTIDLIKSNTIGASSEVSPEFPAWGFPIIKVPPPLQTFSKNSIFICRNKQPMGKVPFVIIVLS